MPSFRLVEKFTSLVEVDEQREARPGFTCSGWRPQPDKFRTPDEFRNGNLACWSAVSERSADGRRTDNGRYADAPQTGGRNRAAWKLGGWTRWRLFRRQRW